MTGSQQWRALRRACDKLLATDESEGGPVVDHLREKVYRWTAQRTGHLKRTGIQRTTPLSSKSRTKKQPPGRDDAYRTWIRQWPCLIAGKHDCGGLAGRTRVEPAHVKTWASSRRDHNNIWPACPRAHGEQEGNTAAFEKKYNVNLKSAAKWYTARYRKEQGVG